MGKSTKQELNYITYRGPHPHVSVVDLGVDFTRDEPIGPFSEDVIAMLTKTTDVEGKSVDRDDFIRAAAPAAPKTPQEPTGEPSS